MKTFPFKKGDYVKPMGGGLEPTGRIIGILPRKGQLEDPYVIVEYPDDEEVQSYSYMELLPSYPTEPVGKCVRDEDDKSDPLMLGGVVLLDKKFSGGWGIVKYCPVRNAKLGKPVYVDKNGYYCKE